ncbi:MAG: hypothetical protein AAB784_01615 [Patescibacteria group bacterium]
MEESQRRNKKLIVAVIFFLIIGGIGFLIFRSVVPPPPKPTPNPTINLLPIQVIYSKLFDIQNNDYDFLAKVYNPNTSYGSGNVEYVLKFYDIAGEEFLIKPGNFYILPGQTKYVAGVSLRMDRQVSWVDFEIKSVDWQNLDLLSMDSISLVVKNSSFIEINRAGIFAKVGGEIFNNSNFDLNLADVVVILLDQSSNPIALNRTELRTFLAGTTRGIETTWFVPFVGQVNRVDVEATTNIFENSNFLRQYGGQEKFKQLY